jgi:shikimate dehydrogenase
MVKQLGLIGYPLGHSFSKKYFTQKFENEGLTGSWYYELYPIERIELLADLLKNTPNLVGLNVTIPYKEQILPYLDDLNDEAKEIEAVNCIKIISTQNGKQLRGYNTDVYGFEQSLLELIGDIRDFKALILGTGGAAKAVKYILIKLKIPYQTVSRQAIGTAIAYEDITDEMIKNHRLIINTTPLGMTPKADTYPPILYESIDNQHFMYDLVYNPEDTLFLQYGKARGAKTMGGLAMLYGQAEKAWAIWNDDSI